MRWVFVLITSYYDEPLLRRQKIGNFDEKRIFTSNLKREQSHFDGNNGVLKEEESVPSSVAQEFLLKFDKSSENNFFWPVCVIDKKN